MPRRTGSTSSMISMARTLGAPLRVPAGTQDGRQLRIRGQGAPKLKGGGKGDLIARLRVTVPKKLTKKEREALEELQKVSRENPREALFA